MPGIIRSKLIPPPIGERVVARPRLATLIAELIEQNRIVMITATAGSGKSTAVVQAAELSDRQLVWLTLDATDAAPGRLLVYLEAAIAAAVPSASGVAGAALAARLSHKEAAGLLADAMMGAPVLLVIDSLEHLAEPEAAAAVEALGAFIRYAPAEVHTVLLSRVDIPLDVSGVTGFESFVGVGEEDLAFTPPEAAEALRNAGIIDVDAHQVVVSTGGWVTGVLFEAWRSREHVTGTGGELDPLHGYLATQILGRLRPEECDFLTVTSIFDEVTAERAAALGQSRAGELLVELRAKHLPVSWTPGTYRMRCHPRFREYLLTRLHRRDPADVAAIHAAHAEILIGSGHHEEAVEALLAAEDLERAVDAAVVAIPSVINRLDLFLADRWLAKLAGAPGARRLAEAELMLAIAREDYSAAVEIADRALDDGYRDELARSSSSAASMMAWSYWHLARLNDARDVVAVAPPSPALDTVHYLMTLVEAPTSGERVVPPFSGGPLDGLLMRVNYAHGRLREVFDMPVSPWAAAVSAPWRVGVLRATGQLSEGLELYRTAEAGNRAPAWLHGMVGPELMIDLARGDEARVVLARGREFIQASGSIVFQWLNAIIEAKLELRLYRNLDAAMKLLNRVERAGGREYGFVSEALDTWSGMAALLADDAERAETLLSRAVGSMVAANRILDLPIAAMLLAEAHWRLGDIDAADEAADMALAASAQQGSFHQMLTALADFPAVASRRLDAEPGVDSPWHEVSRALVAVGSAPELGARHRIAVSEFGAATMTVDGTVVRPRIAKSVLLLAYLATRAGNEATRDDLLLVLFDGKNDDSAKSYLRQTVHRLREVLPEGLGLGFEGDRLRFSEPVSLTSESVTAHDLLVQAGRVRGDQQRSTLLKVITILDRGEYLPGLETEWVRLRREELVALGGKARLQAAQTAFDDAHYREAEELAEAALASDAFQESAWRLLMRIGNAVGDEDRILTAYRRCVEALSEIGVKPSDATTDLLGQLRR